MFCFSAAGKNLQMRPVSGWRPRICGGNYLAYVASFALFLEIVQGFTPDRFPDFMGAFFSVSGVLTATLLADFTIGSKTLLAGRLLLRAT